MIVINPRFIEFCISNNKILKSMNKVNSKIAFLGVLSLLIFGTLATSCSKDDDKQEEPVKGTIDAVVGTYKGSLRASGLAQYEYFDAILIVSKVDNNHVKVVAKSGENYSSITPKTFKVEASSNGDVNSAYGILEGYIWYTSDVKTLEMSSKKQAATDIYYLFDGVKQ